MSAKIDAVLLGVADIPRCVAFYEALGFKKTQGAGAMAMLHDGATRFAAVSMDVIGSLTGEKPGAPAPARMLLSRQCRSQREVDTWCELAEKAGGRVVRKPAPNDWGGYSCAFADPDGHVWNVGFNLLFFKATRERTDGAD